MAQGAPEIDKLAADFRSGRNPMAFLPLCSALRRERRFAEALEVCQTGIARTGAASGQRMRARLLADLGRYDEGLAVLEALEGGGAGAAAEKARCLIALHRFDEAGRLLEEAERAHPMDPSLQAMRAELRAARERVPAAAAPAARAEPLTMEEACAALRRQIAPLGKVLTLALLDLDTGKSVVEGETDVLESAEVLHMENAQACSDLDFGELSSTTVELEQGWVLVVRERRRMAVLVFESGASYGKWHHRVRAVLEQVMDS